jgi:hypothetical protein
MLKACTTTWPHNVGGASGHGVMATRVAAGRSGGTLVNDARLTPGGPPAAS